MQPINQFTAIEVVFEVNNNDSHLADKTLEATDVMALLLFFCIFLKLFIVLDGWAIQENRETKIAYV